MKTSRLTLKKEEILSKRDDIGLLFSQGAHFKEYPFKVVHRQVEASQSASLQIGIAVPKKLFKKAVTRNLLKRRCKEAYRHHKNSLKLQLLLQQTEVHFMLIYLAKEPLEYNLIEQKIILILQRLQSLYAESTQ
jgi:ribonuclease P protein component